MDKNKIGVEQELYLAPEKNEDVKEEQTSKNIVRISEIPELRTKNSKTFRMSDGTKQAVFYPKSMHVFNNETNEWLESDTTLKAQEDGLHYCNSRGDFTARFSCEENDELFLVEKGDCRITISAKKNKKAAKKGMKPIVHKSVATLENPDILTYEGENADFEYSVAENGVKENIIVKEKTDIYRYPFILKCENVSMEFNETNMSMTFANKETGEDVFFIPSPFMKDANGNTCSNVAYEVKKLSEEIVQLSVIADSDWINADNRALPITIDPQINIANSNMSTFSYCFGNSALMSANEHVIGNVVENNNTGDDDIICPDVTVPDAIAVDFNDWYSGNLTHSGEKDWYKFTANATEAHFNGSTATYNISINSTIPTATYLFDSNSNMITSSTNSGYEYSITAQLQYGNTYYVAVESQDSITGDYGIRVGYTTLSLGSDTLGPGSHLMYMNFNTPTLPNNAHIKKAEITLHQAGYSYGTAELPKIGIYEVNGAVSANNPAPENGELLDYEKVRIGNSVSYTFDITDFFERVQKGETAYASLAVKLMVSDTSKNNTVILYGSNSSSLTPEIKITYDTNYGVNTSYRTHTHQIGAYCQGSVDLLTGNLMLEFEDFNWGGNKMPVTIKHLYNSAFGAKNYTYDSSIALNTADFSAMKIGSGFKLNIMQSMREIDAITYVYIDERGDEVYLLKSNEYVTADDGTKIFLYKEENDGDLIYNPSERVLTKGEDKYIFYAKGRLIKISDKYNSMLITYTNDRISSVTDGAGRDFVFNYNSDGYLISILAPDNTCTNYSYDRDFLSTFMRNDGKREYISWLNNVPTFVSVAGSDGNPTYVAYYGFNNKNKLYSVQEIAPITDMEMGNKSTYTYSAAANRTTVQTTIPPDTSNGETESKIINTVYTFDNDGNIVSKYAYFENGENVGIESESGGINPHSADGGAGVASNVINLLTNHSFENGNTNGWYIVNTTDCDMVNTNNTFTINVSNSTVSSKYGKHYLWLQSKDINNLGNGVCQTVNTVLSAGQYTFSAFVRCSTGITGYDTKGAYLRVIGAYNNVIGESEHIYSEDKEYTRLVVPFELSTDQPVTVQILLDGAGTVYVDAAQLEKNPYANDYNMLENSGFENGTTDWTVQNGQSSNTERFTMTSSLCLNGNITGENFAYQEVKVKTPKTTRETFTLSGWAKGNSIVKRNRKNLPDAQFRLCAVITYTDGTTSTEPIAAEFSSCTEDWQFASVKFSKDEFKSIKNIKIYCDYSYNTGKAYFDNIQLVRNSIEMRLTAEDFIVVEDTEDTPEDEQTTNSTEPVNEFEELIDAYGNTITQTTFTNGEFGTIYRSYEYNEDADDEDNSGNNLVCETDARGNKTQYIVDEDTSRNTEIIDRCGNKTVYEYNNSGKTSKITSYAPLKDAEGNITEDSNGNIQYNEISNVAYSYNALNNLEIITRGDGMKYCMNYSLFHKLESIGIVTDSTGASADLISYVYKSGNGGLREIHYLNGNVMKATFNSYGQLVAEKWFATETDTDPCAYYKYVYDNSGNIVRSIDITAQKEYNYTYDNGRIERSAEYDVTFDTNGFVIGKTLTASVRYSYDEKGLLSKKTVTCGDNTVVYYTEYPENSSPVVKILCGEKTFESHSKTDSFGRKVFDEIRMGTGFVSRQFSYHTGKVTDEHKENAMLKSSATTPLVSQIVLSDNRTLTYEYDEEERITKVTDSLYGITEYTYDALGQLLTEVKEGQAVNTMTYDNYGNILTKNGVPYSYHTGVWKDLLGGVGNRYIAYDSQGNPTEYLGHTLTWEKGRQLKSFDCDTYTYNANGIRTSKTVDGVRHDFVLNGTKILAETWGENTITPLYDNTDSVCGITYNNNSYFFLKNLQGDVIGISDVNGETVASYVYDAWGKILLTTDTSGVNIANINPYRYRGYYYDIETELYYLQSRYYDPNTGRFINADSPEYVAITGGNLFTYCKNCPTKNADYLGFCDEPTYPGASGVGNSSNKTKINTLWVSVPIDLLVVAISPWLAATFDGFGITLNVIRGFFGLQKAATYVATKIAPVIINGFVSPILTLIRTVLIKIFNSVALNLESTFISYMLSKLTSNISYMTYVEMINFVAMFFSLGSFIAGILDFITDGLFDGCIIL